MTASLPLSILREAVSHPIIIETTHGARHEGRLSSLDAHNNLTLENVLTRNKTLQLERQERLLVKQSTVKFIQLPAIVKQCPQLQLTAADAAQQWKAAIRQKAQLRKDAASAVAASVRKGKSDAKKKNRNGENKNDGKTRRTNDPKKAHAGGAKKKTS